MLHRGDQRGFHYQFFRTQMPRGRNYLICRANVLLGLERLPAGRCRQLPHGQRFVPQIDCREGHGEVGYTITVSPSTTFLNVALNGSAGQPIDFASGRTGTGADTAVALTMQALLAFRRNWQSVLFVDDGDNRVSSDET